ncbi:hypothetical protein [cf. Phormidesmis sp. LEGE 11477]|uniref:hypothetical protein n=1 Tax=cf. Phormidesmis sp. LEGE 11477 TaxID=1828680 RepID=UPI00187ECF05|nr:hypothetical protein [cf. Phormidesmis sp. LEGE 11477]MBE9063016.1 hypothetical protein [cf. Phormidesmis sp. LEGE 11477]
MFRTFGKCCGPLFALLLLAGCGSTGSSTVESSESEQVREAIENSVSSANEGNQSDRELPTKPGKVAEDKPTPDPVLPVLQPGRYCYSTDTDFETTYVRLSIDSADRVVGDVQSTIHNEENGYYTSYVQALDGTIDGSNLNLDVATWIEYDQQNRQETWKVSDGALKTDSATLEKEKCVVASKAFQNEDGLEAADLTESANHLKTTQVFFDAGESATTVSNAVVRGDRDVYLVTAQGGQMMTLSVSSAEDNAVFDVVSPSNMILGTELRQAEIFLPHTGDYKIIVGGSRGNATYDLKIGVN